ncbi:hypothetical protein D9M72_600590 [compost metagenome]
MIGHANLAFDASHNPPPQAQGSALVGFAEQAKRTGLRMQHVLGHRDRREVHRLAAQKAPQFALVAPQARAQHIVVNHELLEVARRRELHHLAWQFGHLPQHVLQ